MSHRIQQTYYHFGLQERIAVLSDIHDNAFTDILKHVRDYAPNLILIPGDVLNGWFPENDESPLKTEKNVLPFFRACVKLAPTYFSLGNHEWLLDQADLQEIADTGVIILDNAWVQVNHLVIGGLTSNGCLLYRQFKQQNPSPLRYPEKPKPSKIGHMLVTRKEIEYVDFSWLEEYAKTPGYHILLCHHPEYFDEIPDGVQLIISGHAHGGQIRIFHRGLWAPGQGWFPKLTSGIYQNRMVVSRGLANTTRIPRLRNPLEIVYID